MSALPLRWGGTYGHYPPWLEAGSYEQAWAGPILSKAEQQRQERSEGIQSHLNFEKSARRAGREDAGSGESGSCLLKYKTRNDTAWRTKLRFCSQGLLNDKKMQWGEVMRRERRRIPCVGARGLQGSAGQCDEQLQILTWRRGGSSKNKAPSQAAQFHEPFPDGPWWGLAAPSCYRARKGEGQGGPLPPKEDRSLGYQGA